MLYLMSWNYKNRLTDDKHSYDVEGIRKLSISQGVWTLVFPELEKYADLSAYQNEIVKALTYSIRQSTFQLGIISDLNAAGLRACLLKGAAIAAAYPDPPSRVSADTDILIEPEKEPEVIEFLKARGFSVKPREKNDHHFKAYHPIGGVLEGHVRLYSIPTEKVLLDGASLYSEEWSMENIDGYDIPILGLNDGLIYLTAHYIKHLVNEGGGVRQMLDLLLYIERYKDKLDFERYDRLLKQLRYDKLVDVIKTIGAKYWGFDYPIRYEELAEKLLTDSEEGGIFGYDTDSREGFYKAYCDRRAKAPGTKLMVFIKGERDWKKRLFPSRKMLCAEGFKGAENRALYPYYFILHYIKKFKDRKHQAKVGNKFIDERLDLMKDMEMIT